MKSLKFEDNLVKLILSEKKTATWRLFDDKNLSENDIITCINKHTGEKFGEAKLISISTKALGALTDEDWKGHERFISDEDMYKTFESYYSQKVGPNTEVKLIQFIFTPCVA